MYVPLILAVKALLAATGLFSSVQCGIAPPAGYPSASLWLQKSVAGTGKTDPTEDETLLIQIQSYPDADTEQSYLDLLALVAGAKAALHGARLPGRGAKTLQVPDLEAMQMATGGPTIYVLRVTVKTTPSTFATT